MCWKIEDGPQLMAIFSVENDDQPWLMELCKIHWYWLVPGVAGSIDMRLYKSTWIIINQHDVSYALLQFLVGEFGGVTVHASGGMFRWGFQDLMHGIGIVEDSEHVHENAWEPQKSTWLRFGGWSKVLVRIYINHGCKFEFLFAPICAHWLTFSASHWLRSSTPRASVRCLSQNLDLPRQAPCFVAQQFSDLPICLVRWGPWNVLYTDSQLIHTHIYRYICEQNNVYSMYMYIIWYKMLYLYTII